MLTAALSLMVKDNYIKYNGCSKEILIPVNAIEIKTDRGSGISKSSGKFTFQPIEYLNIPIRHMWNTTYSNFQWNKLGLIYESFSTKRIWSNYTYEVNFDFCIDYVKSYCRDKNINKYNISTKSEFKFIYTYLYRQGRVDDFNKAMNINTDGHTIDKCVEIYKNDPKGFSKKHSKEYSWLWHNDHMEEFKRKCNIKRVLTKHTLERCIDIYKKNPKGFSRKYLSEYYWLNKRPEELAEFKKQCGIDTVKLKYSFDKCVETYKNDPVNFKMKYQKLYWGLIYHKDLDNFKKITGCK